MAINSLEYYILGIILVYIPFHLCEEALGNFPLWMKEHKYTPIKLSYGYWMAGNVFFYYPLLVASELIYHFGGKKFMYTGMAVLIWGILNFFEHLIFTVKDLKVCARLYTGILFFFIGSMGLYKFFIIEHITLTILLLSILVALICAIAPVFLQKFVGKVLWKNFN